MGIFYFLFTFLLTGAHCKILLLEVFLSFYILYTTSYEKFEICDSATRFFINNPDFGFRLELFSTFMDF